ncbi:aldo/keto reductase [Marispirochaeta aestuarii]|uniref:Aldo/keto reductase n=1 Tax=Marispirochaeta aestuarii TaxID=1963862 RepID=A0A1Y1RT55_9SPIO|nr:aldo/keto reductase [Marispirochaeta aestuarii]ORC30237.1 aldo/keto reductase [Marispirochaeta aestuarii]
MKMMKIGKSGIEASALGLGAWAIGGDSNWGPSDDAESIKTIHRARELGITLVDTAPAYGLGHSEEVVGKALKGRRDQYVLATKCGIRWDIDEGGLLMERDGVKIVRNASPARLAEEIEWSLKRLDTDYLDLYIVHWQATEDYPFPISETMGYLMDLKAQGKIRAIGASNLNREQFMEYVNNGQLDLIQEKYSMLDRGVEEKFFGLCKEHGVTFQAYSPLERGVLTGKYGPESTVNMGLAKSKIEWYQKDKLARIQDLKKKWQPLLEKYGCSMTELVLAWTMSQGTGDNVNVLGGARKIPQIEENVGGGNISVDASDLASMRKDVEAIS